MKQKNLPSSGKTRSFVTGLILALALLLLLNLVSSFFYYRIDLSKGKIHTLSKASRNLVHNLKDNLVIKVYLSDNLPPEYNALARYAKDLLAEYKQAGGRHVRYEFVSRTNEDAFRSQAARDNIFAQRTMILENDRQTVRDIYMGMAFEYKGNRKSLNLSKDIEGRLEYEITSLLRRLTNAKLPKVTVFQDSLYNSNYYQYFEHYLNQNYDVLTTNLTAPVKASDVMIFTGVADSLSSLQLYNLDQYIMHGGKVIFLQERVEGDVQYGQAYEIKSNIFRLLKHYGIEIKPNLVMDQNCAPIKMSQRSGIFVIDVPVPYPFIPMVQGSKNSVISKGFSDILLYYCSELNTNTGTKNITATPLLKTSSASGIMNGPDFQVDPNEVIEQKLMSALTLPPVTVGALFTGTFTSFYADNPSYAKTAGFSGKVNNGEIIVVTDSDLIRDYIAGASDANIMFILNAADFLLKDLSLSEVRSRTIPNSPLDLGTFLYKHNVPPDKIVQTEPNLRQIVKILNILLPSLLLILYGLRRMYLLKKERRLIQARFQPLPPEPEPSADEEETEQTETEEPSDEDKEQ